MERELAAILHELKRLRMEGEDSVYISDEAYAQLKETADKLRKGNSSSKGSGEEDSRAHSRKKSEDPLPSIPVGEPANRTSPGKASSPAAVNGAPSDIPHPPSFELEGQDKQAQWEWLKSRVEGDSFCLSQVKGGKNVVLGVGNLDAEIFFCGEAPGAEEEIQGEPFVGSAGQLLTKIIQTMGLSRDGVYIGNIMNYRPPISSSTGNRPPTMEEMAYCLPYLRAQLEIVQPKIIVALGKTAVDGLLGHDPKRKMGKIRGIWHHFENIPLMPTFHPSYLLRSNTKRTKRMVWEDMLAVMEKLEMPITEAQKRYFL